MRPFLATYRLQLNSQFRFADARALVPYLQRLGVSHLYLSPIWQARPGSTHGYDVIDPTTISEDLGGESEFVALANAGLGIIVDLVPNHMAVDEANPFWADEGLRQKFFDIDPLTRFRRRFFDVNDLAGVRVEDPEVFAVTHGKAVELLAAGLVDGIRVDHIDGLAAPAEYLARLRGSGAAHVWVEKILEPGERLRPWPIEGTTGYDFLNDATALFVDPTTEERFTALSGEFRGFAELAHQAKLEQANTTFAPEVAELHHVLAVPDIASGLAALHVYRTYVTPGERPIDGDDEVALRDLPPSLRQVFEDDGGAAREFTVRFQQTSGAVMAKGVEDTALYRYPRLLALNEVGGDPQRFGLSTADFHLANQRRAETFPRSMLASQTHDTKRSGDVRARLVALTHIVQDWTTAVETWHTTTERLRSGEAPDWNEELLIYQTLVGAWPIGMDRLGTYLTKAMREAKRHSSWTEPNEPWETRVIGFAEQISRDAAFLRSFEPFAARVTFLGERISLAQTGLRLGSPGTPDIYQGDELWNYALVDPDNRRPVDWRHAEEALRGCGPDSVPNRANAKLFVITTMLALRQRRLDSFSGGYQALSSSSTTCAFRRGDDVVVAAALREAPIAVELPAGTWVNLLRDLESPYSPAPLAVYERVG